MNKEKMLKTIFWDKNVDSDYLVKLLGGQPEHTSGDRADLYRRLLTSYDWYTLLELIPVDRLKDEVLKENVIRRLFPKELRDRFYYAKEVLSR